MKGNNSITGNTKIIAYKLSQLYKAKYLVIVASMGMTCEVNHFISFKEAKRAFYEIAHDRGCEPKKINSSDKYYISIWKWTEDRHQRVPLHT
ncbi:MAG: hypothetical protein M1591_11005 [Deltaproteobacteria bacterium]|nr:hypothetical protein [Deltaproteobacteria bacterium]